MLTWLTTNLLWTAGIWIFITLAFISLIFYFIYPPLLILSALFFIFSLYFFRNPERVCIEAFSDPSVLICPADGKVVAIEHDPAGGIEGYHYKISIFLSPFDVHVNWSPIAGIVDKVQYKPGTFTMAFLPKSSLLNERNDIHIRSHDGKQLIVRQIAGTVARKICCWVYDNETIHAGQKIGMIRFGSRVDLLLPHDVQIAVEIGQRVYGGQTVIGRW